MSWIFEDPSDHLKSVLKDLMKIAQEEKEPEEEESEKSPEEEGLEEEGSDPIEVLKFFHDNPNPSDSEFHAWAESHGMDPDDAEEIVYRFVTEFANFAFGGKSGGDLPEDLDEDQLSKGIEVELEHTPSRAAATKIALDHLTEFPNYYDALAKMEASLKGGAGD